MTLKMFVEENILSVNNQKGGSEGGSEESSEEGSDKSSDKIIALIQEDPYVTADQMAEKLGITRRAIEKHIKNLKDDKRITRFGPKRGGHWEILKEE